MHCFPFYIIRADDHLLLIAARFYRTQLFIVNQINIDLLVVIHVVILDWRQVLVISFLKDRNLRWYLLHNQLCELILFLEW